MPSTRREAGNLELIGGHPCLDFTNTVSSRVESFRTEYLTGYDQLVDWSGHAGLLSRTETRRLKQLGGRRPTEAAAVLERALELRETLFRLFSAMAQGRAPRPDDLDGLNLALRGALGRRQICRLKGRLVWGWAKDPDALEAMLWPIVHSAAELLTLPPRYKVRRCAGHPCCQWLFLDQSKNQTRRWCSMELCGSRDKVKRYYHRQKAQIVRAPADNRSLARPGEKP
ncbi:MAG: ABATE domain-containing protein [Thermodesulfobacteriota bacterium]